MRKNPLLKKTLKIFFFLILPLTILYGILNTSLTGFSISSDPLSPTNIVLGTFLGIITLFFIITIFLIKLRTKN